MIVLDTNVVSEAMKPEPSPAVLDWLNEQTIEAITKLIEIQLEMFQVLLLSFCIQRQCDYCRDLFCPSPSFAAFERSS
ncbi:MAG: hypothetical protein LBT08_08210, partial [Synergistaceae bacterium]|nr:hypothetical protein [Synergistaceae bacterium]